MTCSSGKLVFSNRTFAKKRCKKIKALGGNRSKTIVCHKLRPYRCRECGMWHLTSMSSLPGNDLFVR